MIVTILALVLIVLPSVQSAYQVMSQMATVTYLVLVIMIYCAFFRLRHTESKVRRGYRVPGGNFGKWLVTLVGVGGAVAALVLSFLPPGQINTGSPVVYIAILLISSIIIVAIPFIIYAKRKPSWHDANSDFYPFNWMIEGRKPDEVSKWPENYVPTQDEIEKAFKEEDQS